MESQLVDLPAGFASPFYYGSLSSLTMFLEVDLPWVRENGYGPRLPLADFDGTGLVVAAFQSYVGVFNEGSVVVSELSYESVVVPSEGQSSIRGISTDAFLRGVEQAGVIGRLPLRVLCDNGLAVDAGRELFGEPKDEATFECWVPSPNGKETDEWRVRAHGSGCTHGDGFDIRMRDGAGQSIHPSALPTFGVRADGSVIGSRCEIYRPLRLTVKENIVSVSLELPSYLPDGLRETFAAATPVGVWSFMSDPVAARCRPYRVM